MSSRDPNGDGQPSSKPISLSLSGSNAPSKKTGFNLQSSNRGRATDSPAAKGRSLPRRPHQLAHGDDSDEEEAAPVHEEVSGFDTHTGGAITVDGQAVHDKNQPLVIPVTSKNNWRDRAGVNVKKGKNLLPREVQAMQEAEKNGQAPGGDPTVQTDAPSMAYGLSFAQQSEAQEDKGAANEDRAMPDANPVATKPLTDDEIAMQALIRETKGDVERRTDLVIESTTKDEDEAPVHYSETSSFRTDVASRPDPATLDAYNAIPVEEFGAALLRGMGWKDGQSIGKGNYGGAAAAEKAKNARVPERRPGFLGIGAKDASGGKGAEAELGAWGKSAMRKASRKAGEENGKAVGVYMPVTMRNKKTGEHLTEEELEALKKEAKAAPKEDDWRERRDHNLEKSGRDKDREYRKRDYDDEGRSHRRNGSSRRDRSLSSGRQSSRRSRYDDDDRSRRDDRSHRDRDYDRDRRRDRHDDKDRRRDRDRDHDRDRSDRHRDDKYSSSRSSHSSRHDRDRDRDRDSRRSRRDD
ncbi:hypothetical protein PENARI_c007G02262 [Penicillium arizonense]|uniref:Pre-mRNA-splicing factor n=1 Tax=Penicillium arizonense TaxID=1835702 RepID=A0A1F5LKN0_PENAI|nr:hypothetical protein PENARI_c007G02262 [Penicillium arizonense]OGE53778.1 hypothetical protein PENARI_c007G02262 [Penicillium arizonense]